MEGNKEGSVVGRKKGIKGDSGRKGGRSAGLLSPHTRSHSWEPAGSLDPL